MVSRSRTLMEDFDRGRTYLVVKPFAIYGRMQIPGATFEKDLATTRKLRQLYEGRYLRMAALGTAEHSTKPGEPIMPNFPLMDDGALRAWLAANQRIQHVRATRDRMVQRAIRRWNELQKEDAKNVTEEASVSP